MNNKEYAEGLRLLADWYERNETVPNPGSYENYDVNSKDDAVNVVRALGSCHKRYDDNLFRVTKEFGAVTASFIFMRGAVCTRRVVGEEEIPEEIVPAHTREIIAWDCHPVLAA